MQLECIATTLNLRTEPKGAIIGELRYGDLFETADSAKEWVTGIVLTGISAGKKGYLRRKWLVQHFDVAPNISSRDRAEAAKVVASRTKDFDQIRYDLGSKAKTWNELAKNGYIDCSGWIYLLGKEVIAAYNLTTDSSILYTYSDEQIINCGTKTGTIISSKYIQPALFQPGVIIGIDFAEYSWDRGRPLDIDHIAIVGADEDGLFISQSSGSGSGVNKVPLSKWLESQKNLITSGKVHLVDLLSMP